MLILKAGVFTCLWEWAFFSLFKNYELSAVTGSQEKCLKFSNEQLKAIEFNKGACLVLAGPGSGKTTVLTGRVKYLIDNCHVKPSEILVITFTKAAATEMKNRFTTLCGRKLPVTFGTFHAVYFSILKYAYNYTVDNIIKDEVREQIIKDAVERSNIETEDINETINLITGEISRIKTEGIDIDAYYSTNCPQEEFKSIFRRYESELKRKRLIDFDDMLLYCRELFLQRKDILLKWQQRYKYILIDEFQDINKVQYDVIRMLAEPERNIFIVGDDDQSIYGFRGSRPEIMLNFEKDYPEAEKIILDINYRSTSNIVDASGYVIRNNKVRFDKNIHTDNEKGDKVDIIETNNINEEYDRIVKIIRSFVDAGKQYADFAVLFRTNVTAAPLVRKFMENNIPFVLRDGIPNIFEHWIAKDILTYMTLAEGGRKRADFIRIMNKPLRYIGRDYVTDSEVSFDELEKYYEVKPWMINRIRKMERELNAMSDMTCYAMINYLRKGVGYDDYVKEYAKNHSIEPQELSDILDEIMESSKDFIKFDDWREYIEKYTEELKENHTKRDLKDYVTMTTMHSSKGLEYDTVFIIDANEGITPHKKAVFDVDIEEERRMFYVAMTRAKKKLYIFCPKERYNKSLETSRFVNEIMNKEKAEE